MKINTLQEEIDRHLIFAYLLCRCNKTHAARKIDVSIRSFRDNMKRILKSEKYRKMIVTAQKIEKFIHLVDIDDMTPEEAGDILNLTREESARLYTKFFTVRRKKNDNSSGEKNIPARSNRVSGKSTGQKENAARS